MRHRNTVEFGELLRRQQLADRLDPAERASTREAGEAALGRILPIRRAPRRRGALLLAVTVAVAAAILVALPHRHQHRSVEPAIAVPSCRDSASGDPSFSWMDAFETAVYEWGIRRGFVESHDSSESASAYGSGPDVAFWWKGKVPARLKKLADTRICGVDVLVYGGARYDRLELLRARDRVRASGLMSRLGISWVHPRLADGDVKAPPGSGLTIGARQRTPLSQSELKSLRETAGVAIFMAYGANRNPPGTCQATSDVPGHSVCDNEDTEPLP